MKETSIDDSRGQEKYQEGWKRLGCGATAAVVMAASSSGNSRASVQMALSLLVDKPIHCNHFTEVNRHNKEAGVYIVLLKKWVD